MKKTLVALAALAATGAFAQVSLTGNVTMGYEANTVGKVNGTTDNAGLGTDTTSITFKANEDMGGGYAADISMTMDNINRSGPVAGKNASLGLVTPVGKLTLATAKAGDYLSGGLASVGSYYSGWDGKIFGDRSNRDSATFTVPFGAVTASVSYQETAGKMGLGDGTQGDVSKTGQSLTALSVSYSQGALNANVGYLMPASSNAAGNGKSETRLSANYDLGVAKLGGGLVMGVANGGTKADPKVTDIELAALFPMSSTLTIGASWVSRKWDDAESLGKVSGTNTGYSLEAQYALSKRTSLIANYARWTQGSGHPIDATASSVYGVVDGQAASTKTQILLSHSF